jgi:hypothetical protein
MLSVGGPVGINDENKSIPTTSGAVLDITTLLLDSNNIPNRRVDSVIVTLPVATERTLIATGSSTIEIRGRTVTARPLRDAGTADSSDIPSPNKTSLLVNRRVFSPYPSAVWNNRSSF